jgi:glycerol-3-phosphate dehydrogenase (NAD(P)+)
MESTKDKSTIAVLGAGSWGTALAILLSRTGKPVILWAHSSAHCEALVKDRQNSRYIPDAPFPDSLQISQHLDDIVKNTKTLLIAVPSHVFRQTLRTIKPLLSAEHTIAWASKGFETGSGKLLHDVVADELDFTIPTAVISGPTFAKEVAMGLPTAVTVASTDEQYAEFLANRLHDKTFRAYTSDDVIGVEIGGSVKNVLAIAAGIADGLGFGANTRAALITRGLNEMMQLGKVLGGKSETFMGLAGLGDLVLTCTDDQSRNRRFGLALGRGGSVIEALSSVKQVVEGMHTAIEVHQLAQVHGVEMPITEQVFKVINENLPPRDAVHALLTRDLKSEIN